MMEGGGSIILDHYQARLNDGGWHSVQLFVESRLAVLVVDNITHSASLNTLIRTGGLVVLGVANIKKLRISTDVNCLPANSRMKNK